MRAIRKFLLRGVVQKLVGGLNVCLSLSKWTRIPWWVGAGTALGLFALLLIPKEEREAPAAILEFLEQFLPPEIRDVPYAVTDFCDKCHAGDLCEWLKRLRQG